MRYIFVRQHETTDCAAACLAMVCLYYKKDTTISKLRDMMGTDLKGTNLLGLASCAEELGFSTQAVKVDKEAFLSKFTLPAIANILTKEGLSHYVVLFQISKKYVVVGDPAKDLIRMKFEDFYRSFTGTLLILKPNDGFEKDKIKGNNIFARYLNLLLPQRKLFFYGVLASFLLTLLGVISSIFNNVIYDEILPYNQKDTLRMLVFVFLGVSVVQIVLNFVRQWMMMLLSIRIDIPLTLGYFEHVYKLPMKFFSTRKTGDITTRFSDAFVIKDVFTSIALTLIMDIGMTIVSGVILFRMNIKLFSVLFFMIIVSILLVLIFKLPYKKINEQQMQQSSVLNSQIIEGLRSIETIKANAGEESELENLEKEYIKSLRISYKEGMLSNVQGTISNSISVIGNVLLTYIGIMQVLEGNNTLGSMMAFMTLTNYFMDPVSRLINLQLSIQEANISMKRISEIMDYDTEQEVNQRDSMKEYVGVNESIEFKNVKFRYGKRQSTLNNISFSIPKGKKIALVGTSGSGKTTIAKLLLKYYEIEAGEITIDGVNINDFSNSSIRKKIAYVPQNIELFSKSIINNIRIGRMNATLEEVKEASRTAGAHEFIKKLPMQYETYLEEAGNGLSGGEKQRIALARAFLKKSDFYILDESTSNLDFATENAIFDMIYNKFHEKTMLIIAHRLATIKNCDEIIVIDQGQIVEKGTHEELINKKEVYFHLWELQQGNLIRNNAKEKISIEEISEEEISYS